MTYEMWLDEKIFNLNLSHLDKSLELKFVDFSHLSKPTCTGMYCQVSEGGLIDIVLKKASNFAATHDSFFFTKSLQWHQYMLIWTVYSLQIFMNYKSLLRKNPFAPEQTKMRKTC